MNKRQKLRAHVRPDASWYRIRNSAGTDGPAEVVIYDEIGFFGVSAQSFYQELSQVKASEITLRINSPGGEIFDGIAIMNALRSHHATVTTYVDGIAASIASVIAMAGDRIVMAPHSQMMIHDGSGVCIGNAQDMQEMADLLNKQSDNIAAIYNERAGGGPKFWRARMLAETWYSAKEAVDAGLADEVASQKRRDNDGDEGNEPDGDDDDTGSNRWDLSVFNYAGRENAPDPQLPGNRRESIDEPAAEASDETVEDDPVEPEVADQLPVLTNYDADVMRSALRAAAEGNFAWGAGVLADTLTSLATSAAAPPAPRRSEPAVAAPADLEQEPDPEPDPEPGRVLADTLAAIATDAPAAPAPPPPPLPPRAAPPVVEPAPPRDPMKDFWSEGAAIFAAGVALAANDRPAPTTTTQETEPEPVVIDGTVVIRAFKEAMQ